MSNNYQWQKQQTNDRVHGRMREAQAHRLLKEGSQQSSGSRGPNFLARLWSWLGSAADSSRDTADQAQTPRRATRRTAE